MSCVLRVTIIYYFMGSGGKTSRPTLNLHPSKVLDLLADRLLSQHDRGFYVHDTHTPTNSYWAV